MEKSTKYILIAVGITALSVTGYLLFFKKDAKSDEVLDNGGASGADNLSKDDNAVTVQPKAPQTSIIAPKLGTTIFTTNNSGDTLLAVARKTTSDNEKLGSLIGFRTIKGVIYAMFYDTKNSGKKSLVNRTFTNLKNI